MAAPLSPALFDQFARGWRGYALIVLIALSAGVMGVMRAPVTDIDEARFAQATRQMVDSGDYVRIMLQDAERSRKPIGIHWLQSASVHLTTPFSDQLNAIWRYRLVSVLGLVLAGVAALWAGTVLLGSRAAFLGAALYCVALLPGVEAMLAKTDSMMVGFTTLAVAALAHMRMGTTRPRLIALAGWAALACGILVKGVVTPIAVAATIAILVIWERKANWLRPLAWWPGPLLAAALLLPWAIAIGVVTDGRFYAEMLARELGPKLSGTDHAHGGLPGYHLMFLPLLIFPATYALPSAARLSWIAARAPRADETQAPYRFLMAWAGAVFVFFEAMPTKLLHYTMPAYPAIALLCGAGLLAARGRRWRTLHPAGLTMFVVYGLVVVALMAFVSTFMPGDGEADLRRAIATGLIGAAALGAAIAGLAVWRRAAARVAVLAACALVFSFSLRERLLPEARALFASQEAVAALTRARLLPRAGEPFWVVGYAQPSLVFLTQTSIRLTNVEDAAQNISDGETLIIEGRVLHQMTAALSERQLRFEPAEAPARAMAIGRGERVELHVGRVRAASTGGADAPPRSP
jgi:4-amino-4-deoxy-L-arabinose transferase-like glycosyltransferase